MAQGNKRGRNQRRRSGPNINRAMDSTGPEVKIRGTANQIYDKYLALARDAASGGDRIRAESLMQHAEHYFRVMKAMQPPQQQQQQQPQTDPAEEPQPGMEAGDAAGDKPAEEGEGEKPARPRRSPRPAEAEANAEEASADNSDGEEAEKPKRTRKRRAPRKPVSEEAGADEVTAAE